MTAALRTPKLTFGIAFLLLVILASILTYAGFLVVGVLADYLGTGRILAGFLLGVLFARFPLIRKGKLQVVGLLPKPLRRPLILGLLALCCVHFLWYLDYVPAAFTGFATVFLLTWPWLRRAIFDRILSSVSRFFGRTPAKPTDATVIDVEFREKKE
jgi:drug/metabolite transporter (DMT)-like permease